MKHKKMYSVSMFWNKRGMDLKTKVSTISLTVNLPRQQFRVSLKLTATKVEYDLALSTARKVTDDVKELRNAMNEYLMKAEKILDRMPEPSKDSFVRLFKSETDLFLSNKTDLLFFYQMKMDEAEKEGRIGTRYWYRQCMRCLANYSSKVCFEEIDERWLKAYQLYLKGKGNSDTTCGMQIRCMRGIFNYARKKGFISSQCNPFETFKIASSVKSKSVLYPSQLKALYEYQPNGVREKRAKDYFFFCYLANGMNFKDMTLLKWRDMKGDSFTFIREKTKLSNSSALKEIRVYIHEEMKRIIADHCNKSQKPDDYVFPILKRNTSLMIQHRDRVRHKRVVNRKLGLIGKKLGFEVHLCLNLARHSFATTLKINNVSVEFISDMMGHASSTTTAHYLKSIQSEDVQKLSNQLLAFAV